MEEDEVGDDELEDLHRRDVFGDPGRDLDSKRSEHVVSVHDRVNREVHPRDPSVESQVGLERHEGVVHGEHVVVPVEEHKRLLAEHDEEGVSELGDLGEDEQPGEETGKTVVEIADVDVGLEESAGDKLVKETEGSGDGSEGREDGQQSIPEVQRAGELKKEECISELGFLETHIKWFPIRHYRLQSEDHDHIQHRDPESGILCLSNVSL